MKIIWSFRSEPELAALSRDELKRLAQEAIESKALRRSLPFALMLLALCGWTGAFIGHAFSSGISGSAVGGAVGGFVFAQVRLRAVPKWIKAHNAPSASGHDLTH